MQKKTDNVQLTPAPSQAPKKLGCANHRWDIIKESSEHSPERNRYSEYVPCKNSVSALLCVHMQGTHVGIRSTITEDDPFARFPKCKSTPVQFPPFGPQNPEKTSV